MAHVHPDPVVQRPHHRLVTLEHLQDLPAPVQQQPGHTTVRATGTALVGWNELEQRVFTAQRWWSTDELRTTTEVVFPSDLADVLTRLIEHDESP